MRRVWVDQPSTLQPYHKYHGQTMIAADPVVYADGSKAKSVKAFFTEKRADNVDSIEIATNALSPGWAPRTPYAEPQVIEDPDAYLQHEDVAASRILPVKATVLIRASANVRALAGTAIEAQTAINPLAVTRFLDRVQQYFRGRCDNPQEQDCWSPELAIQNPISRILLDKLASLARAPQADCGTELAACQTLAEGKDVTWPIQKYR